MHPNNSEHPFTLESVNQRWQAVLALDAYDETALSALASNYLQQKDDVRCLKMIRELEGLEKLSKPAGLPTLKAHLAAFKQNHDLAIQYWQEAISLGHHQGNAELSIANQLLDSGDVEGALSHVAVASRFPECSERVEIMTARCKMRQFRWTEAISILEQFDRFGKFRTSAITLLFQCYMNSSRHDSAGELCALLEEEGNPQSHHLLGKLYYKTYQYRKAVDSFTLSVNLTDHIESKVWLTKSLYAANDKDSAVAQARLIQLSESTDYLTQGNCWAAAGELGLAEGRYKEAVRIQNDYAAYSTLAKFYFDNRNWGKAYYVLRCAENVGIASNAFRLMENTICELFQATNASPPKNLQELSQFDFYSSENIVTCLVERIVEQQPPIEVANSNQSEHKVVMVVISLGPGGAERQAVNLANGLANSPDIKNVDLLCTYLNMRKQDSHYLSQLDPKIRTTEYYQRDTLLDPNDIPELKPYADLLRHIQPLSRQQIILHLAKKLLELQPDVVHGWLDDCLINTALVCRMLGIKNIVGRWGSMPPGVNRSLSDKGQSDVDYLQHAYREIRQLPGIKHTSNSRLTADAYAELMRMPKSLVQIVYNGIDDSALAFDEEEVSQLRASLGIPEDSRIVGTVFRISDEKRPILWVDIALKLLEQDPDLHFIIVGTGPMELELRDYINASSTNNIHMVGKQSRMGPWYRLFDVLLLTSRVEGVPNVAIESQYCGCPVVASDVGGLPEAVEDTVTGYLLSDHSVENFSCAVQKLLLDNNLRQRLGQNASGFSRNKFSIVGMVDNYKDIFFDA